MIKTQTTKSLDMQIFEDMAYKLFESRNFKFTRYNNSNKNIDKNNYKKHQGETNEKTNLCN